MKIFIKISACLVIILMSGCSMLIEKSAKYSEFALEEGHTKEDIHRILGKPIKSSQNHHCNCEVFAVEGRIFDSSDYWAASAGWTMTLGIHEIFFFPMSVWEVCSQAIYPTQKELEICSKGNRWYLREVRNNQYMCEQTKVTLQK